MGDAVLAVSLFLVVVSALFGFGYAINADQKRRDVCVASGGTLASVQGSAVCLRSYELVPQ